MKLEDIISKIDSSVLERVVTDDDIIGKTRRDVLFKSLLPPLELARWIIEEYGPAKSALAHGLYVQIRRTDWPTAELLFEHFKSKDEEHHNLEASLVTSNPDLNLVELNEFLTAIKNQVCLIVSRRGRDIPTVGTGFLVGPDLVLTCHHVLKGFQQGANAKEDGTTMEIYFDFHRGEPVKEIGGILVSARKVKPAEKWFVAECISTEPDGVKGCLAPPDKARIEKSLDFMLVRLEEKVGLQPVDRGGGRTRRWVDFSASALAPEVTKEDWIIIPQHREGYPLRIDLGRFRELDQTATRLRYKTNTAGGSSGAPCFNHYYRPVGVHNAFVGTKSDPELNQAIWARRIVPGITPYLESVTEMPSYVSRWSLSQDIKSPQSVLGRDKLLEWLRASATPSPKTFNDRVYVAHTSVPAAGCSFSIEILLAETRETQTPRVVYGQCGQQLPATAEDFIRSMLRELGISLTSGEAIPPRPQPLGARNAATGVPEVDKLVRWISNQLPDWLSRTIDNHVMKAIDVRENAKQTVAQMERNNPDVPEKLRAIANSNEPVFRRPNAWDYAYVVFDDLRSSDYSGSGPRTELKGEVRDLIAAMVKGSGESVGMPGLNRLRWMFLGYLPDFVQADQSAQGVTIETLDPAKVGINQVKATLDRMSQAHPRMELNSQTSLALAKALMRTSEASNSVPRLVSLQRQTNLMAVDLLELLSG